MGSLQKEKNKLVSKQGKLHGKLCSFGAWGGGWGKGEGGGRVGGMRGGYSGTVCSRLNCMGVEEESK